MDVKVLLSLAAGSLKAKEQLNRIQETASSLEEDGLAYLTYFFYMTERLRLVSDTLEKQFHDREAVELRGFVEKRAEQEHLE